MLHISNDQRLALLLARQAELANFFVRQVSAYTVKTCLIRSFPDALSVSQLTHIIIDISFRDAKKRNLLDIPENRDEIFKTVLGAPKVLEGIKQGKIHVVLF